MVRVNYGKKFGERYQSGLKVRIKPGALHTV